MPDQPAIIFGCVGVAIFAVLAAILFPVFARARAKMLQHTCLGNIKQMGGIFALYATDYDGRMPLYDNHSKPGTIVDIFGQAPAAGKRAQIDDAHPVDHEGALSKYVKNANLLVCPADPAQERKLSYTWNELFAGYPQGQILNPANKVLVVCEGSVGDFTFVRPTITVAPNYDGSWARWSEPGNYVHNSGLNILYVDGHCKWLNKLMWPLGGAITPGNKVSALLVKSEP